MLDSVTTQLGRKPNWVRLVFKDGADGPIICVREFSVLRFPTNKKLNAKVGREKKHVKKSYPNVHVTKEFW